MAEDIWTPQRLRDAVRARERKATVRRVSEQIGATLLALALAMAAAYWAVGTVLDYQARIDCQMDNWSTGEWTMGRVRCIEYHALRPDHR